MGKEIKRYPEALTRAFTQAAEMIVAASGRVVCLTGAGVSVDSGIPAFRGSQGLWDRYDPLEYAEIDNFRRNPEKVWGMLAEMLIVVERAVPNQTHKTLAEFEEKGWLQAVITQNVDGLHQAAGARRVIEFHGTSRNLVCLECDWSWPRFSLVDSRMPPRCRRCNAILKPDVVFFGEQIPRPALLEATAAAEQARVMLVVGTSANVHPAAEMPVLTKKAGGRVIEINLEPTPLSGRVADLTILGPAAIGLSEIMQICERIAGHG
ncbi:MAG TPA: NAD-dependent protein deacylase [Proteobacteria bacterium]|nr:NAD-dependent protein deacylase [Pseudomonadota bacterium]